MNNLSYLVDYYRNAPRVMAFLLGIVASISPCAFIANIAAVAHLSKNIKSTNAVILNNLFYLVGKIVSYTILATIIYYGAFTITSLHGFRELAHRLLGPILLIAGIILISGCTFSGNFGQRWLSVFKQKLASKGYIGSLLLGIILAQAFCPYSAMIFFGVLIPLILNSGEKLLLAPIFALGTSIPIFLFSILIMLSFKKIGTMFAIIQKLEKIVHIIVALIFILVDMYYLKFWII